MSLDSQTHDFSNPNPWLALLLDKSTFIEEKPKKCLMRNNDAFSRKVILPLIRPFARLSIGIMRLIRIIVPDSFKSSRLLHKTICWGMNNFVSNDANYLIIRHFTMGSQVLAFLNDNVASGKLKSHPLKPKTIEDLADNVFLQHDLNIYNFIIQLNEFLRENKRTIESIPLNKIDFSAIQDFDDDIKDMPNTWHNFLDLQSAIELYTPLFALLLGRDEFERSSNSLQLDETIAIYVAKIFDKGEILGIVSNKHPMVPLSTFEAGFRLMLHGLDAENLYGFIKTLRDEARANHLAQAA